MNTNLILSICCTVLFLIPAVSFAKIGLDINGGALVHKQTTYDFGIKRTSVAMGGAGALKVTYQAKYFEVGPYIEYGGMQRSSYLLLGGSANVLLPITDFQLYAGATGGMTTIGGESGSSIGAQVGTRFPLSSNLHFNTEVSFRHIEAGAYSFNALGVMAGFHVKF